LNERALEVSPRIKMLDGDFREQSLASESYLRVLGSKEVSRLQEEFLQKATRGADGENSETEAVADDEFHYEIIDEVPVVDFE
jgi:hypothetical protein